MPKQNPWESRYMSSSKSTKTNRLRLRKSLQLGPVDCGPANLRALCEGWGIQATNLEVRSACGMNNAGTSIFGLNKAAGELGLITELKPLDLFDLRDHADLYLPAIIAVEANQDYLHFLMNQ